ncbi:hypothetical protein CKAH01_16720 [Colletotrichum kahawae]|uniref:Rhamnogalacturonase A/B/Epimerase-like pectate lyase domain-containing protein n=1 Tax=Colletotrichum kahawae TaxID=34407 RepID=A0AAD9YES0_COLKA|nr:hypothetical protein CKAH01_16720 [Colletotrichum kahawae]
MRAVRDGNRCGKECGSSSTLQAVVYFPSGTYLVSSSIVQYYLTQFIGDATDPPTIKASPAFVGLGVISTNVYDEADGGKTWYVVQSNFFRQVRNFVMDISEAPRDQNVAAIHWQVGQATSLENIKFRMSTSPGNNQQGIFMESGSGGFLSNLEFDGGAVGAYVGNQQFTVRGLSFSNHQVAAIHIHWSWGWTWKGVEISRCPVGVLMVTPNAAAGVGSAIFLDSAISDTNVGFRLQDPADDARITLSLFNLNTSNVPVVVEYTSGRVLLPGSGGEASVAAWGVGKRYDAADAGEAGGVWQDGEAYARVPTITESLLKSPGHNRPQYATRRAVDFLNVKKFPFNAAGDGTRDDTFALNLALVFATASGMIVWIPAGVYRVTDTVHIPRGAKVVGQSWSQIMGTGEKFQDAEKPRAVVRVGNIGDVGDVEIQDLVFTVRGPAAGAVLLQWNIHEQSPGSAAMWDTHIRVGGQAGSNLQAGDCPKNTGSVNPDCVAAALLVHITSEASAYFENAWFWVADHVISNSPKITKQNLPALLGVLVESIGPVWLYGTGSEHCVLYQYQTVNAANIFMGMIQSESPYFQPVPRAPAPFAAPSANFSSDPRFGYCADSSAGCAVSWGLRFINSNAVYLYGAGVYSFFSGYYQACVEREDCQDRIVEVETSSDVWMFSLVTKAALEMISPRDGVSVKGADNKFNFCSIVMAWLGSASQRRYGDPLVSLSVSHGCRGSHSNQGSVWCSIRLPSFGNSRRVPVHDPRSDRNPHHLRAHSQPSLHSRQRRFSKQASWSWSRLM